MRAAGVGVRRGSRMNRLRIVAVMEAYSVTGPAKNLLRFAARLREHPEEGIELSVLTFYRGAASDPSNQFIEAARSAGIELDVVPERFAFDPAVRTSFAAAIRKRAPQIVQTHAVKAHFLFRISDLRPRHFWVGFHHGYTAENLKMRLYNQLNRFSLPAADRVLTVCTPFAGMLSQQGVSPTKIHVLPNSVEIRPLNKAEQRAAVRARLGFAPEERMLLSVGRLSREKGHADVIAAMAQLQRLVPGTPLRHVLVGDGPERQNLEQLAAASEVAGRFVFAGHHRDVSPFYAAADVFLLPSHSEGSPNVLLEAMAAGLPVVACSVGGVPETATDEESALLVQPRQPQQLASAAARLLGDPKLASVLGRNAQRRVQENFTPEAYFRKLVAFYRQCVPQPRDT